MGALRRGIRVLALVAGSVGPAAWAQQSPEGPVQTPILTVDQDRLFEGTLWGRRVADRVAAASSALAAENRRIEADLTAEERALTDARATLPAEEFRKLADAFDARVTEFRRTQDGKARAIARMRDAERQAFFKAALPVMAEVLRGHGAIAVLDNRAIFLAADAIDATDEMIARIDAEIGAGADAPMPDETESAPGTTDGAAPPVPPAPTPAPTPAPAPRTTGN